mmetsp:Transcript_28104/g.90601  ORF Transcript_28104/g.90601 Transcript_28104/m.90601 type:complete len:102 (+) Transcript_28104:2534-2839(+)
MKQQGALIGDVLEKDQPWLLPVPISIFDAIVNVFVALASTFDGLRDTAELAKIGRYYAVEDMLTTDPIEKYGDTSLQSHYQRVATEGQEYDPYTTILGAKK